MNDLLSHILRKGLEKATIHDLKEAIDNDPMLSKGDKTFLDFISIRSIYR